MDSKLPAQTSLANVVNRKPYMNKKLIHWTTLTGKNNHCNKNHSPVMTPQRTVAVFLVTIHASPWQPFLKYLSRVSCIWLDALSNGELNGLYQKSIRHSMKKL